MKALERTAESYEELLVPALFDPWARRMAGSAVLGNGSAVLDVACGTGVLARTIRQRHGSTISISGIDLNPGMLAVARRKAPEINWHEGNAESLPFGDETFDAVLSQFGLMFFTSPARALRDMHRVLRSGGTLSVIVFDSLSNNRAYETIADVYERVVGSSVAETLRFPFSMGDTTQLAALFDEAGMSNADVETHVETARFSNPRHMVLADVKGWFSFADIHLDDGTLQQVIDGAEHELEPFLTADGAMEFSVSAHMVSATKS